ncbi:MotA/TolQ/ExbB proton channel family protein, partial [Bacillus altitudinis]|uniref:MotA/TolQ/ExbB proton channel family protein n=1 Tax=Bacillus altitudinis TaxID=293387 RepID=UPI00307F5441
ESGALIFTEGGRYGASVGVVGGVVGVIGGLGKMGEIEAVGDGISGALVGRVVGIFRGYVLWDGFGKKVKGK